MNNLMSLAALSVILLIGTGFVIQMRRTLKEIRDIPCRRGRIWSYSTFVIAAIIACVLVLIDSHTAFILFAPMIVIVIGSVIAKRRGLT